MLLRLRVIWLLILIGQGRVALAWKKWKIRRLKRRLGMV